MGEPFQDANFGQTLRTAIEGLADALAKRWRKEVAAGVAKGDFSFPTAFRRDPSEPWWDYTHPDTFAHTWSRHCEYVKWASGDQTEPLSSVVCKGKTDVIRVDGASTVLPPDHIVCGMGTALDGVGTWAYEEAYLVLNELPKFDAHDQHRLRDGIKALRTIAGSLGAVGDGADIPLQSAGSAVGAAARICNQDGQNPGWWDDWTDLTARHLKTYFFASVAPSMGNQAQIAAALSNLYTHRSAMIDDMRRSDLSVVSDGIAKLDAQKTVDSTVSNLAAWRVGTLAGDLLSVIGSFGDSAVFKTADKIGKWVKLLSTAGAVFDPDDQQTEVVYENDLKSAVEFVWGRVEELKTQLTAAKEEYEQGVRALRDAVYELRSYDLELYDPEEGCPEPDPGSRELNIVVSTVVGVGLACMECAESYEDSIIPELPGAESAEPDLADETGSPTWGDTNVKELLAELRGYLTTACGRLYYAGDQIKAAAEEYARVDDEVAAQFERSMEDWTAGPAPAYAGEWAAETDRNTYEEGASAGLAPGHANGEPSPYEADLSGG
ncbi:hypothetical protein GCM10009830_01030 [Glycomyces endophyticus]|uniref:WXG100 family type VII secretion target n=1 Tax=Glycomyces endophyticus TaxID=480996 RepID=A0ABP4RSK4_9ACTN